MLISQHLISASVSNPSSFIPPYILPISMIPIFIIPTSIIPLYTSLSLFIPSSIYPYLCIIPLYLYYPLTLLIILSFLLCLARMLMVSTSSGIPCSIFPRNFAGTWNLTKFHGSKIKFQNNFDSLGIKKLISLDALIRMN